MAIKNTASHFRTLMRQNPTDAEAVMWEALRNRSLGGYKFARQVTVGKYTADFICRRRKLIVEIDGPGHEHETRRDRIRTGFLNAEGYGVLRFTNNDVMLNRIGTLQKLLLLLETDNAGGLDYSPPAVSDRTK